MALCKKIAVFYCINENCVDTVSFNHKFGKKFFSKIKGFLKIIEQVVFTNVYSSRHPRYFNLNLLKCGANCLSLRKLFFNELHRSATRILFHFSNMLGGENSGS